MAVTQQQALFNTMVTVLGLFMAPTFLPLLAGLVVRRLSWQGAFAGFLGGLTTGFLMLALKTWYVRGPNYDFEGISLLANTAVTILGMLAFSWGKPESDAVRRFLKELGTDYIDLVQIHCMTARDWTSAMRRQMDQLEELKEKGLIRAHGVSCHSVAALEAAAESDWVEAVHARFNHLGTKMDDRPEVVQPILKRIHDAGKGVIAMKVVGEGAFSKDPELREKALRFVMGSGCVDVMIVGFELESEMDEFKSRVAAVLEERTVAA